MKILVVGSGGREHALVWKLAQSPRVRRLFAAPGNAGIADQAECVPLGATDVGALATFAEKEKIDLTVVGPEVPLTLGLVDEFQRRGHLIFGDRDVLRIAVTPGFITHKTLYNPVFEGVKADYHQSSAWF